MLPFILQDNKININTCILTNTSYIADQQDGTNISCVFPVTIRNPSSEDFNMIIMKTCLCNIQ